MAGPLSLSSPTAGATGERRERGRMWHCRRFAQGREKSGTRHETKRRPFFSLALRRNQEAKIGTVPVAASSPPSPVFLFRRFVPRRAHHHHSPSHWLGFSVSRTSRPPARSMQAPPLAALAGGAWASHRPAILAAPASLRRPRRGALRLPAWRAAGGGRAPRLPAKGAVLASDTGADEEVAGPSPLLDVRSEQEFVLRVRKEVERGKLRPDVADNFENLYYNYKNAVLQNGDPNAYQIMLSNMMDLFDRVLLDEENPFTFQPYHKAIREPFDYYTFGQNYIRPLVDFRNSYVGNISVFNDMENQLRQGHNVVLMSNHQTEADPAVIALSLERSNPWISENIVYVAGDRVLTDPLCKPFSMGRNLLCVYSKKHMNDFPELIEMKRRANTRSLKEMALLLRGGSHIIWIAPSGGRDRPDPLTGEWHPAPFDASAVDNMRRLLEHSGVPGHIYPLSLLCYEIMPPPQQIEKEIGEQRVISFHGVGLSVAEEIKYGDVTAQSRNADEARGIFSEALYNSVVDQYNVLKSAIFRDRGAVSSNPAISLSQPWR